MLDTGIPAAVPVAGLTGMMLVHNEAGRYLRETIADLASYCAEVVVLDDGSTDDSVAVIEEAASRLGVGQRLRLVKEDVPSFWVDESALRQKLWRLAIEGQPRWLICLDADEMLEEKWKAVAAETLASAEQYGVGLIRLNIFEFWGDREHYRTDGFWNPRGRYSPAVLRFDSHHDYKWSGRKLHCGRFPLNPPGRTMDLAIRLKHYGYANPEDHLPKYERYISADPAGRYCALSHYRSILSAATRELWRE